MTAWDFSPEQRVIIEGMIEAALDRRLGKREPEGITLVPQGITLQMGPPPEAQPFGVFRSPGEAEPA